MCAKFSAENWPLRGERTSKGNQFPFDNPFRSPTGRGIVLFRSLRFSLRLLVGPSGLEPPTLRLSVVRSSQLSYGPVVGADFISLAATLASPLALFIAPPLRSTNASLVCGASFTIKGFGGDSRDRTGDLLLARQALSQLSYIPRPSSGYVYPLN